MEFPWQQLGTGQVKKLTEAHPRAVTGAIRSVTSRMKSQGRKQITQAFRTHEGRQRIQNALRHKVVAADGRNITHHGLDDDPTGSVFSRAIYKDRPGGPVDLLDIFERGTRVQSSKGSVTAIPTAAAGGRKAPPPGPNWKQSFREVLFRHSRLGPGGVRVLGVLTLKHRWEVWYILVPPFKLTSRLHLAALHARLAAGVPVDIDRRFAHELVRLGAV